MQVNRFWSLSISFQTETGKLGRGDADAVYPGILKHVVDCLRSETLGGHGQSVPCACLGVYGKLQRGPRLFL